MLEGWARLLNAVSSLTTPADTQLADLRRGQTILFALIDVQTSGDSVLVAADTTKKIKVLNYAMVAEGTVAVRFISGQSGGTPLTGAMPLVVNTGVAIGGGNAPGTHWEFETAVNKDLVINLSGNTGVRGHLAYFLEI